MPKIDIIYLKLIYSPTSDRIRNIHGNGAGFFKNLILQNQKNPDNWMLGNFPWQYHGMGRDEVPSAVSPPSEQNNQVEPTVKSSRHICSPRIPIEGQMKPRKHPHAPRDFQSEGEGLV